MRAISDKASGATRVKLSPATGHDSLPAKSFQHVLAGSQLVFSPVDSSIESLIQLTIYTSTTSNYLFAPY